MKSLLSKTVNSIYIGVIIGLTVVVPVSAWAFTHGAAGTGPKIGLALSGGGSKGLAHIGVIKVLTELGVPVDYVAGTSMGSIIGGLYAAGYTPDQMTELVKGVDWQEAFTSWPSRRLLRFDQKDEGRKYLGGVGLGKDGISMSMGAVASYKLTGILTRLCLHVADIDDFDRLPIPYRAVATDIINGDKVVLAKGNLALAMRASMSIPGVFPPFEYQERLLVDGGVVENLPVETVREMGAEVVIAVNVSSPLKSREQLKNFIDILDQTVSLQIVKSTKRNLKLADTVISPEVLKFGTFDFKKADELVALGEKAARETAPEITALLESKGVWLARREERPITPVTEVVVSEVILIGPSQYLPEVKQLAPFKPGDKVTAREIERAMQKIYGLGVFEQVNYELKPQPGGKKDIVFIVKEKPGRVYTRFGLRVDFNSERIPLSQLLLNLRRPNTFFSGAYYDLNLILGRNNGFVTSLTLPNKPIERFFLKPELSFHSDLHQIYKDRDIEAEFEQTTAGGRLDAGVYLDTWGEFTLGYLFEEARYEPHIATIELPEGSDVIAGLETRLRMDTYDRMPFPNSGFATDMSWSEIRKEFGADLDFTRLKWDASFAIPLGSRQNISANWSLYTSLDTKPPLSQVVFLGGYPGMLGYAHEEFFGHELARAQLMYRYEMTEWLYLLLAGNAGAVWWDLDQYRDGETAIHYGGGVGMALNTPIGPLQLTVGFGEDERTQLHVHFGYEF